MAGGALRRHSRPNRIISAVEGSIDAGVGVDCRGKSSVEKTGKRKKCEAKQKPGLSSNKWIYRLINLDF